jgi:hypothetical protein
MRHLSRFFWPSQPGLLAQRRNALGAPATCQLTRAQSPRFARNSPRWTTRQRESELPDFLQGTTWVEFRRSLDEEDVLHRLVCGIKDIPPGRRPGASILESECPYLGLKTFQPEDAPLFFGRTAKIQELIDRCATTSVHRRKSVSSL